jgi:hypothetical protein
MKIINKSQWRTDDLRHFAREIAKRELDPQHAKRTIVTFKNYNPRRTYKNVNDQTHGHIYMGGRTFGKHRITIYVGKSADQNRECLAMTLAHEFLHAQSGQHGRSFERYYRNEPRYGHGYGPMRGAYRSFYATTVADWPLRKAEAKPKDVLTLPNGKRDNSALIVKRQAKALKMLATWERRFKLAKSKVTKYRTQVRYYEKRTLAACKQS